ncbi:MAG TPA: Clp protease N-terminal domain-containing protein [Solirubrobacteraceae bacterium]|nr:Clp protease N-terminal domain-containing protein [Solirubrobacteraceae bacterium]
MFERFTDSARGIVSQAQLNARRLGHSYIGCEHLLMAAAMVEGPAGAALREQDITPERIQLTLLGTIAPLSGLDEEALASIGIDLDAVRAKVEAEFGPDALTWAGPVASESRRPAWGKGPLAELKRRRRRRQSGNSASHPTGPVGSAPFSPGPAPRGHIPFTPRAKKTLELSLREAEALHDSSIGAEHITLALLTPRDGTVPRILAALGVEPASVRAAILARYRKAS